MEFLMVSPRFTAISAFQFLEMENTSEDEKLESFNERLKQISLFSQVYEDLDLTSLPLNRLIQEEIDPKERFYLVFYTFRTYFTKREHQDILPTLIEWVRNEESRTQLQIAFHEEPSEELSVARAWLSLSEERLEDTLQQIDENTLLKRKAQNLSSWFYELKKEETLPLIASLFSNCIDLTDYDLLIELLVLPFVNTTRI